MTSDEIWAFCERYVRTWERADIPGLMACYNDDCEVVSPIFNILRGRSQLQTSFGELFRAFSAFEFGINDIIVDRERTERAVLLYKAVLTHRGEIFGMPGTGRRFEVHGAFVFAFEKDLISRDTRLYDFTGMLMQLGVLRARTA